MKLVILDSYALNEGDLDWSGLTALVDEVDACPGLPMIRQPSGSAMPSLWWSIKPISMTRCSMPVPKIRWIGLTATGTDSLDIAACRRHGVPVANVPGYSTDSVAQHVFSLLLSICQCPDRYYRAIKGGCWQTDIKPQYGITPQRELAGKTIGIVGLRQHRATCGPDRTGVWDEGCLPHPHRPPGIRIGRCHLPVAGRTAGGERHRHPALPGHRCHPGHDRRCGAGQDEGGRDPDQHRPRRTGG